MSKSNPVFALPTGRAQAEADVASLLGYLIELATYRASAGVRETALQCLVICMDLRYEVLHPLRRAVTAMLKRALDDNRRSVRSAAVRCAQAWQTT